MAVRRSDIASLVDPNRGSGAPVFCFFDISGGVPTTLPCTYPTYQPLVAQTSLVVKLCFGRSTTPLHLVLGQELHNLHEEIVAAQPVDFLDDVLVQALCERKAS